MKLKTRYHIPASLYKKILQAVPLVYIDAVIVDRGKFLLIERNIPPMRGYWLTPGGMLEKGERLEDAVKREVKEEIDLNIVVINFLGVEEYEQKLPSNITRHCVNFYYKAGLKRGAHNKKMTIKLNFESKDARWFSKIPPKSPSYQTRMLRKAGFK